MKGIEDRLLRLPLKAVVAVVARAARRVQPLIKGIPGGVGVISTRSAQESLFHRYLDAAEAFTSTPDTREFGLLARSQEALTGQAPPGTATRAAIGAAHVAFDTLSVESFQGNDLALADHARRRAYSVANHSIDAALSAADAESRPLIMAALSEDLDRLLGMGLGGPGTPGRPIDPSESGPLGPLWPEGAPEWYTTPRAATAKLDVKLDDATVQAEAEAEAEPPAPPLTLYFDVAEFSDDEIAEVLARLSDLYRSVGGDALVIDRLELLDPASVLNPEGV